MTFSRVEFLIRAELDEATLEVWVAEGWLVPARGQEYEYSETDLARAQLIRDLMEDLRLEGVSGPEEVKSARLERSGELSVIKKQKQN